jgi:hypothetical protein
MSDYGHISVTPRVDFVHVTTTSVNDFTHCLETEIVEFTHHPEAITVCGFIHSFFTNVIELEHGQLETAKIIDINNVYCVDNDGAYTIVYKPMTKN